jgi:hypothetical protein
LFVGEDLRSTSSVTLHPKIFILPECNESRKCAVPEALSAITLTQIDKIPACIHSPNHPKSQKFSDFSLNEGSRRFLAPPLQALILRRFQILPKTTISVLQRILWLGGCIGETETYESKSAYLSQFLSLAIRLPFVIIQL